MKDLEISIYFLYNFSIYESHIGIGRDRDYITVP